MLSKRNFNAKSVISVRATPATRYNISDVDSTFSKMLPAINENKERSPVNSLMNNSNPVVQNGTVALPDIKSPHSYYRSSTQKNIELKESITVMERDILRETQSLINLKNKINMKMSNKFGFSFLGK